MPAAAQPRSRLHRPRSERCGAAGCEVPQELPRWDGRRSTRGHPSRVGASRAGTLKATRPPSHTHLRGADRYLGAPTPTHPPSSTVQRHWKGGRDRSSPAKRAAQPPRFLCQTPSPPDPHTLPSRSSPVLSRRKLTAPRAARGLPELNEAERNSNPVPSARQRRPPNYQSQKSPRLAAPAALCPLRSPKPGWGREDRWEM